jgi:DNA-binding XRE family transcriptional regulator
MVYLTGGTMRLTEFLKLPGASVSRLAEVAGCTRQHMTGIVKGKVTPSVTLAKSISDATGGVVSMEELAAAAPKREEAGT